MRAQETINSFDKVNRKSSQDSVTDENEKYPVYITITKHLIGKKMNLFQKKQFLFLI